MKNTLLALMLVSSLFVISCGADATKPGDLQATSYESKTGTATYTGQANVSTAIPANTIYANLGITGDTNSVKITKIVSMKSLDAATQQYTTDVIFTETKNAAGDIVLSVTPTVTTATTVEIAYQYKIDTYPTDSTGKVDVSKIKPTLEAEVVYNSATHSTAGITVTDPALSLGKKYIYKLYTGTSTEPTATTPADIATEGTITITSTDLNGLVDNDKVYYKIWVY